MMKFEIRNPEFETSTKAEMGNTPNAASIAFPISRFVLRICFGFLISCFGFFILGCHQARATNPLPEKLMASDPDSQIEFWHDLTEQPVCTNDAAFHGLLLYLDNQDQMTDYAARVALLKSRGMLPSYFNQPPDAAIQRGVLAVALCGALKIKGGVTMRVLGPNERYAYRELQFMGLYPPGSQQQTFSGNEYVGVIGRIEDYQRGNPADKPASEMPEHGEASTQPAQ